MEAYDAAVLSYALATASCKPKQPTLLGLGGGGGTAITKAAEGESLTPPAPRLHPTGYLYQLLCTLEQNLIGDSVILLPQLMEICSTKQTQVDQQVIAHLEALQGELRQICKTSGGATSTNLLQFKVIDDDNDDVNGNNGNY